MDITKLTRFTTSAAFAGIAGFNGDLHDPNFWLTAIISVASFLKGFFAKK